MAKERKNSRKDGDWIHIKNASTHNLKHISVSIPRDKMTVITGFSGSGKSSLAFDTIFAEGQRRYVESLSAYARQFLDTLQKPEVEEITGLSPAISIDQKTRSKNPRSTVSTITEIYDYLRVLFARIGKVKCVKCHRNIEKQSKEDIIKIVEVTMKKRGFLKDDKKIKGVKLNSRLLTIYAPVVRGRKGEYYQLLYDLLSKGYEKVRVDGEVKNLRNKIVLTKNKKHTIEVLVDEIFVSEYVSSKESFIERLSDAIERSLLEANDTVLIKYPDGDESLISTKFFCPYDGFSFPEIEPRLFSFNSPYGACPECRGLGINDFFGNPCVVCNGARLRDEALSVYIGKGKNEKNIVDVISLPINDALDYFLGIELNKKETEISAPLVKEILSRLEFMQNVGLEYLTLDRYAKTLSGGESQRIRLASQLGSGLIGALYVLDEPTIGLHSADNARLIKTLLNLRDLGNTIIVVEHDEETILASDYLVDIGPHAGIHGGEIIVSDYIDNLLNAKKNAFPKSETLKHLRGETSIAIPDKRREPKGFIDVKGGKLNNIKNMNIKIPCGNFVSITGVSGSGKSTLLYEILYKNLLANLDKKHRTTKVFNAKSFSIGKEIGKVVLIDQSAIGRTPRSTPATYIGAFTYIRELFASTEKSRIRGWLPGRFSFNVKGGRCEHCQGNGLIAVEMHFLPTVYVSCDICRGRRFTKEVLDIRYNGKNIHEVLNMSVEDAVKFFKDIPNIHKRMLLLNEVGLGYLKLGQSSTTLSGGEAQRVKIATELVNGTPLNRKAVYLLDEPTVGLHYEDVRKLIDILNALVNRGDSVVVIEHNLDIVKSSDYVIDIGPGGGVNGGDLVAKGTPEQIVQVKESKTGKFLHTYMKRRIK